MDDGKEYTDVAVKSYALLAALDGGSGLGVFGFWRVKDDPTGQGSYKFSENCLSVFKYLWM